MTNEITMNEGRPMQGPTTDRPDNPFGGFLYFDTTIRVLLYFDSVNEVWRPAGVADGTTAQRPAATDVPQGTLYYNESIESIQYSDGANWLTITVDDPQSSSSTSSTGSSNSSSSTSSSSSSSSSTSSSTSSNSSST